MKKLTSHTENYVKRLAKFEDEHKQKAINAITYCDWDTVVLETIKARKVRNKINTILLIESIPETYDKIITEIEECFDFGQSKQLYVNYNDSKTIREMGIRNLINEVINY